MDRRNRSTEAAKNRMQALLDEIASAYDFGQFTLDEFARWVERRRGRRIVFVPRPMPPTLFGAWMAADDCDYVFYEENTLPIHQAHIQIHEMAHMLCGHHTAEIDLQEIGVLLRHLGADPAAYESLLLRSTHSGEVELEAETLTALIQERILHHDRMRELVTAISSSDDFALYFADYIETLGL